MCLGTSFIRTSKAACKQSNISIHFRDDDGISANPLVTSSQDNLNSDDKVRGHVSVIGNFDLSSDNDALLQSIQSNNLMLSMNVKASSQSPSQLDAAKSIDRKPTDSHTASTVRDIQSDTNSHTAPTVWDIQSDTDSHTAPTVRDIQSDYLGDVKKKKPVSECTKKVRLDICSNLMCQVFKNGIKLNTGVLLFEKLD